MKLRTKYIAFVVTIHIVAIVLSYFIFSENKILFIVSEIFIIGSVVLAFKLYDELIQPLKLLAQGSETLKDKDFNVKLLPTGSNEMDQLVGVYNKMIDALRSERTQQQQQHFFLEKLINTSPTGILIMDYDQQIHQVNPSALQLLEVSEQELLGKSLEELNHSILQQIKILQPGQSKIFSPNGASTFKLQKSHFIDRGFPRHFAMIEEVTAEILEAEKKAYGKVIRMMAHEVNNTIGPVNSILNFTLESQEHGEQLGNALQTAIERNNNLNSFMRNFADLVRLPPPNRKQIDIVPLVQNVSSLMQVRTGEKKIDFHLQHQYNSMMIDGDVQQMEQALINIIKNAIEAVESEGTITIITSSSPNQLIIRDSGKGIAGESEQHLFTPFYTTKKDGQGVGLTLIREILLNHAFDFSLKTISPGITEFRIIFE